MKMVVCIVPADRLGSHMTAGGMDAKLFYTHTHMYIMKRVRCGTISMFWKQAAFIRNLLIK